MPHIARVGVPRKVNPLVHHVHREDQVRFRALLPEHRAVVPDPHNHAVPLGNPQLPQPRRNPVNDLCFAQANIVGSCCDSYCWLL